jgi:hypothetical protein
MARWTMNPEARIEVLKKAPSDGWVAFSEDESRFVAYGATYDEAVAAAKKEGVSEPVLVKVPEDWADRVLSN